MNFNYTLEMNDHYFALRFDIALQRICEEHGSCLLVSQIQIFGLNTSFP